MIVKPPAKTIVLLIFCAVALAGCGPASPRRPVSGTVTFRGEPLKIGTIQFLDDRGPAGGALIQNGAFNVSGEQGLMPGAYRVWISATEPALELKTAEMSSPPTRELIPAEFNTKTTQTVEVTEKGPNAFSFDIPNEAPKR